MRKSIQIWRSKSFEKWFDIFLFEFFFSLFNRHLLGFLFLFFLLFLFTFVRVIIIIRIILEITLIILINFPVDNTRLLGLLHLHFNFLATCLFHVGSHPHKITDIVEFYWVIMWRWCYKSLTSWKWERLNWEILLLLVLPQYMQDFVRVDTYPSQKTIFRTCDNSILIYFDLNKKVGTIASTEPGCPWILSRWCCICSLL